MFQILKCQLKKRKNFIEIFIFYHYYFIPYPYFLYIYALNIISIPETDFTYLSVFYLGEIFFQLYIYRYDLFEILNYKCKSFF